MRSGLLLTTATFITQCNIGINGFLSDREEVHEVKSGKQPELKIGSQYAFPRHGFSGRAKALMDELKPFKEQQEKINQKLENSATNLKDCYPNFVKSISKINLERRVGEILPQNKIVLPKREAKKIFKDVESTRTRRQVLKSYFIPNSTWKNGIFYTFNTTNHLIQKLFKMGAKVWSDATCIDFVEDKDAQDKVVVVKHSGCWSSIGQRGGDQQLSLGESCVTVGSATHEIGHVLGLYHTMARYDRSSYIKVVKENLDPNCISEFAKKSKKNTDVYGLTYDYGSVMHYGEMTCSTNNQPTMIARDPLYQKTMGSDMISFSDIFMVNEHHGCNTKCNKSTSAKCVNEGFPHPRNCSTCICPGGYGGLLCDRRPSGCGEDLVATNETQVVNYTLGHEFLLKDYFDFCNYLITAPEGKKIEVEVQWISLGYDLPGCPRGGIEIKSQKDLKLTGYRFCSTKGDRSRVVSSTNLLPVILFSKLDPMSATFTYRYID